MSEETDLSDRDLAALAKEVAHRLERRGVLQAGTGAAAGGIAGYLATGRASAADTSSGNVGSAGNSADVFLDQLRDPGGDEVLDVDDTGTIVSQRVFQFPSVDTDEGTVVVDGDSTERRIWVIPNGASDPAGATADDLIFEENA